MEATDSTGMEKHCSGDEFLAEGRFWWRCRGDGTIVALAASGVQRCPHCDRPARGNSLGSVATRTLTQVFLPGWREWLTLPEDGRPVKGDQKCQEGDCGGGEAGDELIG
jgi:hypothetical protein